MLFYRREGGAKAQSTARSEHMGPALLASAYSRRRLGLCLRANAWTCWSFVAAPGAVGKHLAGIEELGRIPHALPSPLPFEHRFRLLQGHEALFRQADAVFATESATQGHCVPEQGREGCLQARRHLGILGIVVYQDVHVQVAISGMAESSKGKVEFGCQPIDAP